jgi:hypothetical protein
MLSEVRGKGKVGPQVDSETCRGEAAHSGYANRWQSINEWSLWETGLAEVVLELFQVH